MKKTTNIYFLIDCSVKSAYGINTQAYRAVIKADRALTCSKFPVNVQTHIIGYNERAFFLNIFRAFPMAGKARFGEGLKLLKTSIEMQRQIQAAQTRSIFLWYSSGEVFGEWKKPLSDLFRQPEFANGLRYSIQIQPQKKRTSPTGFCPIFRKTGSVLLFKRSQSTIKSLKGLRKIP